MTICGVAGDSTAAERCFQVSLLCSGFQPEEGGSCGLESGHALPGAWPRPRSQPRDARRRHVPRALTQREHASLKVAGRRAVVDEALPGLVRECNHGCCAQQECRRSQAASTTVVTSTGCRRSLTASGVEARCPMLNGSGALGVVAPRASVRRNTRQDVEQGASTPRDGKALDSGGVRFALVLSPQDAARLSHTP